MERVEALQKYISSLREKKINDNEVGGGNDGEEDSDENIGNTDINTNLEDLPQSSTSASDANIKDDDKKVFESSHIKKTFECGYCRKVFYKRTKLTRHIRVHTGEKPFKCEVCGESFSQTARLKLHNLKHTGEKPFKCKFCTRCFGHRNKLKRHVDNYHKEKKTTYSNSGLLNKGYWGPVPPPVQGYWATQPVRPGSWGPLASEVQEFWSTKMKITPKSPNLQYNY